MHDSYLFLTPLLTFLVVALVGFVGCDQLFGLDRVDEPPPSPGAPSGVKAEPRNGEVVVSWTLYNGGGDKLKVKWGTVEGSHPDTHVIDDPSTIEYAVGPLMNGVKYYFVVSALKGTVESPDSEEVNATPGLYGVVMPFIDPATVQLGSSRQYTAWMGMGFQTAASTMTLRELGRWFDKDVNGSHSMRIVAAAAPTVILATAVIAKSAASTKNEFVYAPVASPITLAANTDYYVVSDEDATTDPFHDSDLTRVSILNSAAGVKEYAVFGDDAGNYTTAPTTGAAYGPVDFKYTLP